MIHPDDLDDAGDDDVAPILAGVDGIRPNPRCEPVDPAELRRLAMRVSVDGGCWFVLDPVTGEPQDRSQVWSAGQVRELRRAAWVARYGALPARRYVVPVCGHSKCQHPHHCRAMTAHQRGELHAVRNGPRGLAFSIRLTAALRHRVRLSDEAVQDLRSTFDSHASAARRHGISAFHASAIRRGDRRRDLSSPFATQRLPAGRRS